MTGGAYLLSSCASCCCLSLPATSRTTSTSPPPSQTAAPTPTPTTATTRPTSTATTTTTPTSSQARPQARRPPPPPPPRRRQARPRLKQPAASSQQQASRRVDASCRAGCSRPPPGTGHHRHATQLQRTQSKVPPRSTAGSPLPTNEARRARQCTTRGYPRQHDSTAARQHGSTLGHVGTSASTRTPHTLHTANCTPHTAHCTLHTAHRTPHTAHCTLHTAHRNCTMYIAQPACSLPLLIYRHVHKASHRLVLQSVKDFYIFFMKRMLQW